MRKNMGQVITYLVSRGASWVKLFHDITYKVGRRRFLGGIQIKLLHIPSAGGTS